MGYRKKQCDCGCGRVGYFAKYATNACRQRAYRKRKNQTIDGHAKAVSTWLIDMFGEEQCTPIFDHLNQVPGNKNCQHIDAALEQIVYLVQAEFNRLNKKARRVS